MPINPFIGGSLISAGGGLLGSILGFNAQKQTNEMNYRIAKETNEQNYKIWQEQQQHNIDMFNMQNDANVQNWQNQFDQTNAYNSASAQRARLEAAGINPGMMMSGANAGVASSSGIPTANAQPAQAPTMQGYEYTSPLMSAVDVGMKSLSSIAQSLYLNEQTSGMKQNREFNRDYYFPHLRRLNDVEYGTAVQKRNYVQKQNNLLDTEIDYQSATLQSRTNVANMQEFYTNGMIINQALDIKTKSMMNQYFEGHQQLDLINKVYDIVVKSKQIEISDAQIKDLVADAFLKYAQAYEARTQGNKNVQDAEYRKIEVRNLRDISDALVTASNYKYSADASKDSNRYYWNKSVSKHYESPDFNIVRYVYDAFGIKPNYGGTKVKSGLKLGPVSIDYGIEPGVKYD